MDVLAASNDGGAGEELGGAGQLVVPFRQTYSKLPKSI